MFFLAYETSFPLQKFEGEISRQGVESRLETCRPNQSLQLSARCLVIGFVREVVPASNTALKWCFFGVHKKITESYALLESDA